MLMATRMMKGGPFARRLYAVAGPIAGRYSTATAASTNTVTKIVTQPAVHGTVIAHGMALIL